MLCNVFTVRNSSCRKVKFYRCLSVHGGRVSGPLHAGIHSPGQKPPGADTATAADGTHPTGMHSCCFVFRRRADEFGSAHDSVWPLFAGECPPSHFILSIKLDESRW